MKRLAMLLVLTLVSMTALVAPAQASKESNTTAISTDMTEAQLQARHTRIAKAMAALYWGNGNKEAVTKYLEAEGIQLGQEPLSIMSSDSGSVSIGAVTQSYDDITQEYIFNFNFSWKKGDYAYADKPLWFQDTPYCFYGPCNVGGMDLWGINVNNDSVMRLTGQVLTVFGNNGGTGYSTFNPVFNSGNAGAVMEVQDTYMNDGTKWGTYNTDHGTMTMYMKGLGAIATGVQIRSHMSHTWSSTNITGGSITKDGITVNFDTTSNRWDYQGSQILYCNFSPTISCYY